MAYCPGLSCCLACRYHRLRLGLWAEIGSHTAVKLLTKAIGWTDTGAPFALISPGPGDDAPPVA